MFRIFSKKYEGYDLIVYIPVEYDACMDSLNGNFLKDEIVVNISHNSKGGPKSPTNYDIYFSIDSLDKLIMKLSEEDGTKKFKNERGNIILDLWRVPVNSYELRISLEEIRKKIQNIEFRNNNIENSFVFNFETTYDNISTSPLPVECEDYDELLVFGKVSINHDSIDSEFDFADYVVEIQKELVMCDYCTKTSETKYFNTHRKSQICEECFNLIRKRCAEIGNNQSVIREIVSENI